MGFLLAAFAILGEGQKTKSISCIFRHFQSLTEVH